MKRNRKGQFTSKSLLPQAIVASILLGWCVISLGAVVLQQQVDAYVEESIEVQDTERIHVVEVVSTEGRTSTEVALWYMEKVDELLHAEGVENYTEILDEMNQYARDTMYIEHINLR